MQFRAVKAAVVALTVGGLVAGCAGRPDSGSGPDLSDIDHRNFVYRGACGYEKPALDTVMVWSRQGSGPAAGGAAGSLAQVVETRRVSLGTPARELLLVRLQCSIGGATATGWHLLGYDGERPVDLGIVAVAYGPIDISVADGQLLVEHSYRSTADDGLFDSGWTSYRVALAGLTPVRLYGAEQPADIPAEVTGWAASAWRAGIVTLAAPVPGAAPSQHLGVQVDPQTVLAADTLASGDLGCRQAVVRTHTGQRIDPAATQGWSSQSGTRIRLSLPSDAPDTTPAAHVTAQLVGDLRGLLVTGSGLVPALATAAATGATPFGGTAVTSSAPADVALENLPFDRPAAVFREATGEALLSGEWIGPGSSDAWMPSLPDTTVPPDTGCGTP